MHQTDEPDPDRFVPDDRLVTVPQAAERLALSRSKVYLMMDRGDLPYVVIGRSRRIAMADLADFIARHRVGR